MWYCTYVHRLNTLEIAVLVSLNVRDIFIIIYYYIYMIAYYLTIKRIKY